MHFPQPDPAHVLSFCTITGYRDNRPHQHNVAGFDGLYEHLEKFTKLIAFTRAEFEQLDKDEQKDAKNAPAVILATFSRRGTRSKDDVVNTTALALDVDEGKLPSITELALLLHPYSGLVYESARSTQDEPRYRVIIEYARPLTIDEHAQAFAYWRARLPGVADSADPSHLWYVRSQFQGDRTRDILRVLGRPFELSAVPKRSPSQILLDRIPTDPAAPAKEGERNSRLSAYAASIVRECVSCDVLKGGLAAKNAEYSPPLPGKEVSQIASSTWKKRAKFGWHESTQQVAGDAHEDDGTDGADLCSFVAAPEPWIVQDMLTHGAHLLVGRSKGGKSWLTLDLVHACASGATFCGRAVRKTKVLWIAAEDTKAGLSRRLRLREPLPEGMTKIYWGEKLDEERQHPEWEGVGFEQWLEGWLRTHPGYEMVIIDTHSTCIATWAGEQIDNKRNASPTDVAYQMARKFDVLGKDKVHACIVLVIHMSKKKNHGKNADYHEKHNLPATVVAGVTGSIVLDDPPDRDQHDDDDARRILAIRGRHMRDDLLMIEMKFEQARVELLDRYKVFVQTQTQGETLTALEALLEDAEPDSKGERWVTYQQLAEALGKHVKTIAQSFKTMKKIPAKLVWKGRKVELKQKKGVRLVP